MTEDSKEGPRAFAEKRAPVWKEKREIGSEFRVSDIIRVLICVRKIMTTGTTPPYGGVFCAGMVGASADDSC